MVPVCEVSWLIEAVQAVEPLRTVQRSRCVDTTKACEEMPLCDVVLCFERLSALMRSLPGNRRHRGYIACLGCCMMRVTHSVALPPIAHQGLGDDVHASFIHLQGQAA